MRKTVTKKDLVHLFGPKVLERDIERYLVEQVKAKGGEVRKVKWIGRNGAPDRVVMLPPHEVPYIDGVADARYPIPAIWVELKAPGEKCRAHQIREHERMRRMGQRVEVVDSIDRVNEVLG